MRKAGQELASAAPRTGSGTGGVTLRSIVIGLVLGAGVSVCIPYMNMYLKATFMGAQHLPSGAVFVLGFLVLIANPLLRLLHGRLGLTKR